MESRHRLFQIATLVVMLIIGLATPPEGAAREGCWTCVNWGGECPTQGWADELCLTYCGSATAVACGWTPSCEPPLEAIFCDGGIS